MAAVLEPQLRIRPMQRADLDRVGQIEVCVYPWPWSPGIFSDCLRIGYCCRVAEFDGTIDGYAILATAAGEAHLLNLCVAPESRRAGLGRLLLEAMLVEAELSGARRLFLEVRPSNTA
ncbi:MAG: GNAT family N-acetyltransferase, partial [Wenzhouxiangellaceae bacterium]